MNPLSFYFPRFVASAIKGLLRSQNLSFPKEPITYQATFLLTKQNDQRWRRLFSVLTQEPIPFDYYWPHFQLFFFKVLSKLQINYRNILHLGHEVFFPQNCKGIQIGEAVQVELIVTDIALLDRNRAVVMIESTVTGQEGGAIVCRCVDALFIKNLSEENIQQLKTSNRYNKTDLHAFLHLTKHSPTLLHQPVKTAQFYIPHHFGIQYGKVSGDFNPIHTQPWLAKQFGYPQAFVQGSAICNFLIKLFVGDEHETLKSLSLKFCRPIHLKQVVKVYFNDHSFELFNEVGALVTFGKREQQ